MADGLMPIHIDIPANAGWLRLMMTLVPFPVVVVVLMVIAAFVARIAATQGKYNRAE
jgi:heme/copper-type cytochrome/quinol oxidase subunit 2